MHKVVLGCLARSQAEAVGKRIFVKTTASDKQRRLILVVIGEPKELWERPLRYRIETGDRDLFNA